MIGLDLGVISAHSAVVLNATGQILLRRRVVSTVDSLAELEQAALRGGPEQTRLTVVIEPTGPMWLPIAVYFGRQGHTVVRVSSAKAADLRRFLSRHAKATVSMPKRWRGCRWWRRRGCIRSSWVGLSGRRWIDGCGLWPA